MENNQEAAKTHHTIMTNKRCPTIGFLNASGLQFFHLAWRGVADVAREHNFNAISFVGQYVHDTKDFKAQANILYDLIDAEQLDGLVIQDLMTNALDPEEALDFYTRFQPLPIVSIGRRLIEGIPCIQSGGYEGMRKAVAHLITVHGRQRIAFVQGLPNYTPHEERYKAYIDVLAEHGLPFDSTRIAIPLNAAESDQPDWGTVAIRRLLDEQKADIDALVTCDDRFAHNLLPELQARSIRVPDDIALVSFDDEEGSHCLSPPLTTVPIPIYEVGRTAAKTLLAKLEGKKVLDRIINVHSDKLIIRQSCGCMDPSVTKLISNPKMSISDMGDCDDARHEITRKKIISTLIEVVDESLIGVGGEWAERIYDDIVTLLTTSNDEGALRFLATLDEILRQVIVVDGDIHILSQMISVLRQELLPWLYHCESIVLPREKVEDLWLQAQVMIERTAQRRQAYQEMQAEKRRRILNEIATSLATTFDLNDLADILAQELPRLGISRGFLSLYEESTQQYRYPHPTPEWSRLVLAYDANASPGSVRIELEPGGRHFLTKELVPTDILSQCEPYSLIVQALYFQDEQIGFSVFEDGPDEGAIYELLRAQISSALKGDILFQEAHQARMSAEKADQIKTRLLANVSHELRTPLNLILGYSQDMLNNPNSPSHILIEDLEHIFKSAEHQLRVVNDLLDLSRAEIDELDLYLELFDPYPLFQDAFNSIAHVDANSTVTWVADLPERLPLIQADPVRLRQILLNLLSNAQRFTNKGKVILGARVEPPNLHLWVQDSGEGISSGMQGRIFEPFAKADHTTRRPEGIGLGLSITRRLVALHGGSMRLESQVGQGSTFHVFLPLPNLCEKPLSLTESTNPALLLISTAEQVSVEIIELCQRQEMSVQPVKAGDDLEILLSKVQPMALAWDMTTASANEWALVRRIYSHPQLNQLPFILYGHDDTDCHSIGLTSVVTKPIKAPTLLETIYALGPSDNPGPIMIIDDDPKVQETHRHMIAEGIPDYPIITARDGKTALAMMTDQIPSLVLLDLMMPEMDGFEVLDRMRENPDTVNTPVIILTSKVLSFEDIKNIERHTSVVVQTKGVLTNAEMIAALHRTLFGTETLPPQTSALVKRATAYFHQNYNRPLKRWEVAEAVGASENYISRVFNQELGLSPWEYLNRYRINQAKGLLRRSNECIKVIANLVGFKDTKYFSRVFKKLSGVSPSEFRD